MPGDHGNHYHVHEPDGDDDDALVQNIRQFCKVTEENWKRYTRKYENELKKERRSLCDGNGWHEGMRRIDQERYEVQVIGSRLLEVGQSGFQPDCNTFMKLAGAARLGADFADKLISYTKRNTGLSQQVFTHENFSLIITNGEVAAQTPHLDVVAGSYQVAVIMSRAEGTLVAPYYPTGTQLIPQTARELLELWNLSELLPVEASGEAKLSELRINQALRKYKDLLMPYANIKETMVSLKHVAEGTVVVTEGGRVHAGPAVADGFRMVMFASASKKGGTGYDKDDQFFATTVMAFLVDTLWPYAVTLENKEKLLRQLYQTVEDYKDCEEKEHCISQQRELAVTHASDLLRTFVKDAEEHVRNKMRTPSFVKDWWEKHKPQKRKRSRVGGDSAANIAMATTMGQAPPAALSAADNAGGGFTSQEMLSGNQVGPGPIPLFLTKLWQMLSNPAHTEAIAWNKTGTMFIVNKAVLARDVLNIYFCHNKFASFQRQLR
jgi:hypothetical protein